MDDDNGGTFSSDRRESAAEIARRKVLAVYSSTLESLKQNPKSDTNPFLRTENGNQYITPPVPGIGYTQDAQDSQNSQSYQDYQSYPADQASSNYQNYSVNQTSEPTNSYESTNFTAESSYQPASTTTYNNSNFNAENNVLKDAPINQTAVNDEWQKYHSAWQNYYQNYYSDYYAKAAQNYLAAEKLKTERVATGKIQKKRRTVKLLPLFIALAVALTTLFLQYNRLIFAPIMAYVSPNPETVATSIEAINPTVTQAVSADPRLIIPKLNIDVPVAFNISTSEVDAAMNHGVAQFSIPGADALPGQIGNLVISGHSAGDIYSSNPYKFIFSGLERLEVGDLIYVNYESVRYTYQMTKSEVVEPTNVAALIYTTDRPMLTLITCTPLGTSRYRLLISAEQISPSYEPATNDPSNVDVGNGVDGMPANEPSFFEKIFGN